MDKGNIVQTGTPAELLFKPKNKFVREFLQEQRLQLEFRSLTLKDVKQELEGFHADQSVWSVMENLKIDSNNSASFENLMSAFYNYKKEQRHE